jgi:hypothetical protein
MSGLPPSPLSRAPPSERAPLNVVYESFAGRWGETTKTTPRQAVEEARRHRVAAAAAILLSS